MRRPTALGTSPAATLQPLDVTTVWPSPRIPFVLTFALLGCYLASGAWQNVGLIFFLACLGYMLKRHNWPRPPFVIGVVLGPVAEDSLHKALAIWGPSFFLRPLCGAIF